MRLALKESKKAQIKGDIPVGCIIVKEGKIIARAHNQRELKQISTKHAEIIAIEKACKKNKSWRLEECDLYVTLEPCLMCTGAIINARIENIFYGASDSKTGCIESKYNILDTSFNHQTKAIGGILQNECAKMLQNFFKDLRKEKAKLKNTKQCQSGEIEI